MQMLYEHSYLETPAPQKDAAAYTKWAAQLLSGFNPTVVDDTTLYFDGFISQSLPLHDDDTNLVGEFLFSVARPALMSCHLKQDCWFLFGQLAAFVCSGMDGAGHPRHDSEVHSPKLSTRHSHG